MRWRRLCRCRRLFEWGIGLMGRMGLMGNCTAARDSGGYQLRCDGCHTSLNRQMGIKELPAASHAWSNQRV